jgi:Glycosyltransferase Family 4
MRPEDGTLRALRVLYLVHALPPTEPGGAPSVAYEYARRAGARGWKTAVVTADPAVTGWRDVREWRVAGEWFTRYAVPVTRPVRPSSNGRDPKSPATRFFVELLARLEPDLVHVIDNADLPLDWPDLAAEAGVPVIRTVGSVDDEMAEMAARYRDVVKAHPRPVSPPSRRRLRAFLGRRRQRPN